MGAGFSGAVLARSLVEKLPCRVTILEERPHIAGNCHTELMLGFLKNPKYDIRPILDVISKEFIPLKQKLEWGYLIPYAITGILDEHPKTAMALRESNKKEDYREFYEGFLGDDTD